MPEWKCLIATITILSLLVNGDARAGNTLSSTVVTLDAEWVAELGTVLVPQEPDIVYGRDVLYEAYPLAAVLNRAYPDWKRLITRDAVLIMRSHGGYEPFMILSDGFTGKAFLTKRIAGRSMDNAYDCWTEGGSEHCDLGFFLIWTDGFYPDRPQPWGITEIEVVSFTEAFGATVPETDDLSVMAGFETYKKQCIECHRINGQGGAKATDHVMRTGPLSREMLEFFVNSFRTSNPATYMPDFSEILSDDQIDELFDYIDFMYREQNLCKNNKLDARC